MLRSFILGSAAALAFAWPATAETFDPEKLTWLEGCWQGTGLGGDVAECWLRGPADRYTGFFTLTRDGKQSFSEIMVIGMFEDGPALRLKHFDAELKGWEEKDVFVAFPFESQDTDKIAFKGLEFLRKGDDELEIRIKFSSNDGPYWEALNYIRTH